MKPGQSLDSASNGTLVLSDDAVPAAEGTRLPRAEGSVPFVATADVGSVTAAGLSALGGRETEVPCSGRPDGALLLRLLALDVTSTVVSWVVLGYALAGPSTALRRLAPGLVGAAATLLACGATGLYRSRIVARRADEPFRAALASSVGAAAFLCLQWQLRVRGPQVVVCLVVCIAVATGCRRQFARWLRAQRARGRYARGVLLVGSNEDARHLRTMLRSEPELGYIVAGVVGGQVDRSWEDVPTSSSISDIPKMALATGASGILIVPSALSSSDTGRAVAVATAAHLRVEVWPALHGVGSRRLRIVPASGEAFLYVEPRSAPSMQLVVKRAMDVAGAVVGLLLAAPVLAVAAALVKLDSPGPVLHRGVRIGMHEKPFVTYKLRSMRTNVNFGSVTLSSINERTDGPLFKASNDPRVTGLGHFLRSSSIDELPQLWNVLTGAMSLVGPRPALPDEVAQFDEDLRRRHSMRPGITGLWQIEARHNPSFHAYRRLDLSYVDNWSLLVDLSIVVATVPAVLSQAVIELRRRRGAVPGPGGCSARS